MVEEKKIIVYVPLMGDLLHYGHVQSLRRAKKTGGHVVCGLLTDDASEEWWGSVISTFDERKAVLEELSSVDEVVAQNSKDPSENLELLRERFPEAKFFLLKDVDWFYDSEIEVIKEKNIHLLETEYYDNLSREKIISFFSEVYSNNKLKIKHANHSSHLKKTLGLRATKANTLFALKKQLKHSSIEKMYFFTVKEWFESRDSIIENIKCSFSDLVVIRSSSLMEDAVSQSNAGHFKSFLNIKSQYYCNR